ncbi:SGNH/GDSL hydrolase family protein [bacterium]|nr:SGNH/GDSL hydrolase family protein [candidate division CSSED10-310 bacterium]
MRFSKIWFMVVLFLMIIPKTVIGGMWPFFKDAVPPEFTNPSNGSRFTTGDTPPDIRWTGTFSADEYEIRFSLTSSMIDSFSLFSSVSHLDLAALIDQNDWNDISLQLFCQVRAIENHLPTTDWSETLEFAKTITGAPILLSPIDDTRYIPGDPLPVFEWSASGPGDTYVIEFAMDADFSNSYGQYITHETQIDCNVMGNTDVWDLLSGTYFWRVWTLENSSVPSPASKPAAFSKTTIQPPVPLSPEDKTHFASASTPPVFQWEPLAHSPDEYHIQFVYCQNAFPTGGSYITISTPYFTFSSVGITDEMWQSFYGQLRWRVAGIDRYGNHGGFSLPFSFTKVSSDNYMAFGDSVTGGYGASDWGTGYAGYPPRLRNMLRQRYSESINVFSQETKSWFPGGHAFTGSDKIAAAMEFHGPQHVMIMMGIVDIVDDGAPGCDDYDCHTIENLAIIIDTVREFTGIPYLAALPPVNPESEMGYLQDEVDDLNDEIRNLAVSKSVALAPLDEAFFSASLPLGDYFTYDYETEEPDWAHFNDMGYQLIAETWNGIL